jgi:CRISPR type III-A-associated RAMP protein Csm4
VILYRLTFTGPLRLPGDGGLFPRSDTLAAAIASSLASLGLDAQRAAGNPPFAVSSAFPFVLAERGEPVYFLPRPLGSRLEIGGPAEVRTEAKRVRYLSPRLFAWALSFDAELKDPVLPAQEGEVWSEVALPRRLWEIEERPRRVFDRVTGLPVAGATRQRFLLLAKRVGLYFFASVRDRTARTWLEIALRQLADEGLGRGAPFRIDVDEGFRPPAPERGGWILLSLYHPTREEVERGVLRDARYSFVERAGVAANGARRRAVRMIAEGARLGDVGGPPLGTVVKVLTQDEAPGLGWDVYRSGLAVCIPGPKVAP